METRQLDLDALQLARGSHDNSKDAMCIMEAAAFIAGEDWSDAPECVSPVIRSFCIAWNDQLDDEPRNRLLRPFITKVIGTNAGPADDKTRAWMATDWLARTFAPAWLRKAGLNDDAERLANLAVITSTELCNAALPIIREARAKAVAAWDAAWDAAWAAAGDAARAAAWDAAWDAARAAFGDAARAAFGDAAGDAAWDAAWAALTDTVNELQQSAVDLLDRMCQVGR